MRLRHTIPIIITVHLWLLAGFALATERGMAVVEVLGKEAAVPRYHALVIGINDYQHWQDLRQARQDAEGVAALLRKRYGFQDVRSLYDQEATRAQIEGALRKLTRDLTAQDALLIYFAGHGYYDKLLKNGYWIPAEAHERGDNEPATSEWLDNLTLRKYLSTMKARHVLVISDSCFSGSLFRGGRVDLAAKENAWYRNAIAQPSRWAIASGDLETVPDQSVFARKFAQALEYPKRAVFSASDLAGWLKVEVAQFSNRQPVFGPLDDPGGSPDGEFVFLPLVSDSAPAETAGIRPATQPVGPVTEKRIGKLIVKSPKAGTVTIDGHGAAAITPDRALRWERLAVGKHQVRVAAGGDAWSGEAEVREGQPVTVVASFSVVLPVAQSHANSLGMKFVPVKGTGVLFSIWDTRVQDYQAFVKATGRAWPKPGFAQGPTHPAVNVSWNDAQAFCAWLTKQGRREGRLPAGQYYRLPTDAEWSVAVGLGEEPGTTPAEKDMKIKEVYPWGRPWPPPRGAGNYNKSLNVDDYEYTSPVGSFAANEFGLYDMGGNVWQWCEDLYQPGSVGRVLRGASWIFSGPVPLLSSSRYIYDPGLYNGNFGFRCVLAGGAAP
jgi:hypothetical protein